MKKLLVFVFLLLSLAGFTQKINLSYDAAGNQTNRIVAMSRATGVTYKTPETLKKDDFITENQIAYYPNPVLQELYLNWKNEKEKIVKNIQVYNMNGQLMTITADLKNIETATISFETFTEGFYNLILNYENGEKQTLKIIKK